MELCLNTTRYICKSLVQYCIRKCNYLGNDDDDVLIHDCLCDCNSESNYASICRDGNKGAELVVILSILLTLGGICLVCGLCRVKAINYMKNKQNKQLPPAYSIINSGYLQLPQSALPPTDITNVNPPEYESTTIISSPPPSYNNNKSVNDI
jgi:hypothetical protein